MAGVTTHRVLDGAQVEIASSARINPFAHTSSLQLVTPLGVRLFEAGNLVFGRGDVPEFGIVFDEEYEYQGGRLLLGKSLVDYPDTGISALLRMGLWEGTQFSLVTYLHWGESIDLVSIVDLVTIAEAADGIAITPRNPVASPIVRSPRQQVPRIMVHAFGLGVLRIYEATRETTAFLPPWEGLPVAGGELFTGDLGSFVLLSPSAVTHVDTEGVRATQEAIFDHLARLTITWIPNDSASPSVMEPTRQESSTT